MVNFFYSRQQKMKTIFYLKDDNGKLWEEVIIPTFLNPAATLDVFPATANAHIGKLYNLMSAP